MSSDDEHSILAWKTQLAVRFHGAEVVSEEVLWTIRKAMAWQNTRCGRCRRRSGREVEELHQVELGVDHSLYCDVECVIPDFAGSTPREWTTTAWIPVGDCDPDWCCRRRK